MKLYATVTSERASKGQGGSKHLEIEIRDEEKVITHIRAIPDGTNTRLFFRVYDNVDFEKTFFIPKGNKKKDEKRYCTNCGYVEAQTTTDCKECGKEMTYRIK